MDGALVPRSAPAIPAHDGAFAEGRGCYTSVRIAGGRPRFAERHARRLARGALALGFGRVDGRWVDQALDALGRRFADGEGAVRLQLSRDDDGCLHRVGVPRGLGDDPPVWSAITAARPHGGAMVAGGHKLTHRLAMALAAEAAREAGADEALLFDRAGHLVEASRSNLVVVLASGEWVTPPLERGGVAGIAREVVRERLPRVRERDVTASDLADAGEIVAINAVRGARPIVRLDGRPLGGRAPDAVGAFSEALARD